jgi:hypothetical protein
MPQELYSCDNVRLRRIGHGQGCGTSHS